MRQSRTNNTLSISRSKKELKRVGATVPQSTSVATQPKKGGLLHCSADDVTTVAGWMVYDDREDPKALKDFNDNSVNTAKEPTLVYFQRCPKSSGQGVGSS